MEKVILTKEQAEAIEELKEVWDYTTEKNRNYRLIEEKLSDGEWLSPSFEAANEIPDKDFIAALHYGYEVEKSPEEKVRKYYFETSQRFFDAPVNSTDKTFYDGMEIGIKRTLNRLGIKIEGVNA
jgi:hypothetical protein